ncbi:hypothetical protein TNCV_1884491 [Trichonephila clavipes]|nr:hypothetical protein TNCV_1884491 [Trichonephila clavipes]
MATFYTEGIGKLVKRTTNALIIGETTLKNSRWAYGSQSEPSSHIIVVNGARWSSSPWWRRNKLIGRWYVERGRGYEAFGTDIKVVKKSILE